MGEINNTDDNIVSRAVAGEKVACPSCGETLIYQGADSGLHPSIICPSGDYHIRLNNTRGDILERLGLIKRKTS